ncbi:MAG: FAD-dependent oxidoreductase [Firmicutes bacterium]|nr:FAD-dependent oxidoreductase [Bacillota bacterium]
MGKVFFSSYDGKVFDIRCYKGELPDAQEMNLPGIFAPGEEIKAIVGWNGLVLMDERVNVVEILAAYFEEVQQKSCGRCIPCRIGTKVILEKLQKMLKGEGTEADLTMIENTAQLVGDTSLCELGRSAPLPLLHSLKYFKEQYLELLEKGQDEQKHNYRYRSIAAVPCANACPAHIRIPDYIGCVQEGKFEESLAIIREKTPLAGVLGRVCVHPCEENCRRGNVDESISIRAIKRFVADFERDLRRYPSQVKADDKKQSVAVVGAGPAGLTAAYQLARRGYRVTIFEALPVAGGMLAVGIPSYRLPREILQREIKLVEDLGVKIKFNTRVGKDIAFAEIKDKYDAVFVSTGLHESAKMNIEGENAGYNYKGFLPGVEYLRKMNLGIRIDLGEKIAVIGGGNVAMDCARSALRLGVKEVNLIYRRSRAEMPANESEIKDAEAEGVNFHFLANPKRLIVDANKVVALECIRMKLGEPDASGRRRPIPVEGSEFRLSVDTVIPAIGQVGDFSFLTDDEVTFNKRGNINADPVTAATDTPGIFAGGDAVLGARTVIEAVASGNRAADSIDRYLRGEEVKATEEDYCQFILDALKVYDPCEKLDVVGGIKRKEEEVLPLSERLQGFAEVEQGLKYIAATQEADRCLQCRRLVLIVT